MTIKYDFLTSFGLSKKCANEVQGVQVDSRYVEPGHLFFALKGEGKDGHQFIKEAEQKGAVAAVVSKKNVKTGLELIVVDDVLQTLQKMASLFLKNTKGLKVGVTGTVGKTTTKEMIATLCGSKYIVGKTFRNQNSQIGFPLSILNFQGNEEIYILEMGMTKKGHIQNLCNLILPDAALITKVSLVHAQNFSSLDEIVGAKLEIFSKEKTKVKVLDHDLYQFPSVQKMKEGISFSLKDKRANFYLDGKTLYENNKQVAVIDFPFSEVHFQHDLLGAISLCRSLGFQYSQIMERIPYIEIPKMRFEKIQIGDVLFINDAYNASVDSMKAALSHLPKLAKRRNIAVLGSMLELGSFSKLCHEEVAIEALKHLDAVFCIGEECRVICDLFQKKGKHGFFFDNLSSLVEELRNFMSSGDVILVKGSRSMGLEKLFEIVI